MKQVWGSLGGNPPKNIDDSSVLIESFNNHIYFYSDVSFEAAIELNKILSKEAFNLMQFSKNNNLGTPILHLHINTLGGFISAGISVMDTILRLKKDIHIYNASARKIIGL
jgi:ATP-dependent protease ClpP protease subunit